MQADCLGRLLGEADQALAVRTPGGVSGGQAVFSWADEWWKATYTNDQEFLEYNGKDCCITLDVWDAMQPHAEHALATYEHERSLMMPCVDMLARGRRVNETLRRERIAALETRLAEVIAEANTQVLPLLQREWATVEALGVAHLFTETDGAVHLRGHSRLRA